MEGRPTAILISQHTEQHRHQTITSFLHKENLYALQMICLTHGMPTVCSHHPTMTDMDLLSAFSFETGVSGCNFEKLKFLSYGRFPKNVGMRVETILQTAFVSREEKQIEILVGK